jgi:hypothetical protein
MGRDVDRGPVEHHVGHDGADHAAGHLGRDKGGGGAARHRAQRPLDEGDHRVERSRYRPQRQDQGDERGRGGDAVLQQLQPGIVRRQPRSGDARAHDGGDQERRPDELGQRSTGQRRGHG